MLSQQRAHTSPPSSGRISCCAFEWLLFGLNINTHILFKASRVYLRGEMKPAEPDPVESSENPNSSFFPIPFPLRGAAPAARALLLAMGCTQRPRFPFPWRFLKDLGDFFLQLRRCPHAGGAASISSIIPIIICSLDRGFLLNLAPLDLPFRLPASVLGFISLSLGEEMEWKKAGGAGGAQCHVPTSPRCPLQLHHHCAQALPAVLCFPRTLGASYFSQRVKWK